MWLIFGSFAAPSTVITHILCERQFAHTGFFRWNVDQMPDDFSIMTEADKDKLSYGACLGGMALGGMAVGRWLGRQGLLVDGITAAAYG